MLAVIQVLSISPSHHLINPLFSISILQFDLTIGFVLLCRTNISSGEVLKQKAFNHADSDASNVEHVQHFQKFPMCLFFMERVMRGWLALRIWLSSYTTFHSNGQENTRSDLPDKKSDHKFEKKLQFYTSKFGGSSFSSFELQHHSFWSLLFQMTHIAFHSCNQIQNN